LDLHYRLPILRSGQASNRLAEDRRTDDDWDLVIRPESNVLDLHLGDLWRYRDLILLFVHRDFVAQFKQTVLGPAWFVLQPLLTALMFTVVFGQIARLDTAGMPKLLFYLSGNILWLYLATCLVATSDTFHSSAPLFGKVYFPRLAVPISIVLSQTLRLALQFVVFLVFWAVYAIALRAPVRMTWAALMLPVLILVMAALALGAGIIISAATTKYRDLQHLVQFGVQLAMYTTTVIYPLSSLHGGNARYIILANPMTPIIEAFRYGYLGAGHLSWMHLAYSASIAVALLIGGGLLFSRIERTFMDTV
jgi:lipopolysaccharide transport system permease protein